MTQPARNRGGKGLVDGIVSRVKAALGSLQDDRGSGDRSPGERAEADSAREAARRETEEARAKAQEQIDEARREGHQRNAGA